MIEIPRFFIRRYRTNLVNSTVIEVFNFDKIGRCNVIDVFIMKRKYQPKERRQLLSTSQDFTAENNFINGLSDFCRVKQNT